MASRKFSASVLFLVVAAVSLAACAAPAASPTAAVGDVKAAATSGAPAPKTEAGKGRFISIGANPVGAPWYQMAAGFAEVLNKNLTGVKATVEATAGAVENARRLREGTLEISLQLPQTAYECYTGTASFKQKANYNMLAIAGASYAYAQVVTTKDSGIKRIQDLKGKRVGVGALGSGSYLDTRLLLSVCGIDPDKDIRPHTTSFPESASAMKDGQLDAFTAVGAIPQSSIIDVAVSRGILLVPVEEDALRKISERIVYYFPVDIPANSYQGQEATTRTFGYRQLWVARDDLEVDFVYQLTKLMFENMAYLHQVHPAYKEMSLENSIQGLPIPLHPGAMKYYTEKKVPGLNEFIEKMKGVQKQQ